MGCKVQVPAPRGIGASAPEVVRHMLSDGWERTKFHFNEGLKRKQTQAKRRYKLENDGGFREIP
jgi:hypothetical protein